MVLPIVPYGNDILISECRKINEDSEKIQKLIDDMWLTLYSANGAGLAAPQVDQSLQLFIVDSIQAYQGMSNHNRDYYFSGDTGIKKTFINATIEEYSEEKWIDQEGCLSMPGFSVEVERPWSIVIRYQDDQFAEYRQRFEGLTARMIQHEYDHTRGILFLKYLTSFRKARLRDKLKAIEEGKIHTNYLMKYPE